MPGNNKRHATSKAQAGFLGAVIAGDAKVPGLSKTEARDMLRGGKVKDLPKESKGSGKRGKR